MDTRPLLHSMFILPGFCLHHWNHLICADISVALTPEPSWVPEGRTQSRSEPMLPFTPEAVWTLRVCPPFPFQVLLNEQEKTRFLKPFHRPARGRELILSFVSVSGEQVCLIDQSRVTNPIQSHRYTLKLDLEVQANRSKGCYSFRLSGELTFWIWLSCSCICLLLHCTHSISPGTSCSPSLLPLAEFILTAPCYWLCCFRCLQKLFHLLCLEEPYSSPLRPRSEASSLHSLAWHAPYLLSLTYKSRFKSF